jgi:hypothetical protein
MEAFTASVRRLKDTIGEIIDSGSVGINIQKYQQDFDWSLNSVSAESIASDNAELSMYTTCFPVSD